MIAPSALVGLVLFAGALKLVVVGKALLWSDFRWFPLGALISALPVYLGLPHPLFVHKLLWFWSLTAILFLCLHRNARLSGDDGSGNSAAVRS